MGGYTFAREYNSNKINKWFSFVNIISVLMSTLFVVHVIILFLKYDLLLWRFERRWNCDNIIDWRRQGRTRTKKKKDLFVVTFVCFLFFSKFSSWSHCLHCHSHCDLLRDVHWQGHLLIIFMIFVLIIRFVLYWFGGILATRQHRHKKNHKWLIIFCLVSVLVPFQYKWIFWTQIFFNIINIKQIYIITI